MVWEKGAGMGGGGGGGDEVAYLLLVLVLMQICDVVVAIMKLIAITK